MKIQPESLASTITDILGEYQEDVREVVDEAISETAKESQKELKSSGDFKGTSYKKSWKVKIEKKRITTSATLYNSKPGLTHLLEFGHVKQNGGRTRAFPHIAPVNDKVQSTVVKKIEEKIGEI